MAKNKELEQMFDGLRRDYDALVNTLTVRDARIAMLEKGREATNAFIQTHVAPALGAVGYHDAFLRACVGPKGIKAMAVINTAVMAKAKRDAAKRARQEKAKAAAEKLAAPPTRTVVNETGGSAPAVPHVIRAAKKPPAKKALRGKKR